MTTSMHFNTCSAYLLLFDIMHSWLGATGNQGIPVDKQTVAHALLSITFDPIHSGQHGISVVQKVQMMPHTRVGSC